MYRAAIVLLALTVAVAVVIVLDQPDEPSAAEAQAAALDWVGDGVAQTPRRDGDEWEVDVIRPDGSIVEVTIGAGLEVRGFDEERGEHGTTAPDELQGKVRARAILAALSETGPGRAVTVERDGTGVIEVGVVTEDDRRVEVELNESFEVVEVEAEDPRDE
jgi:hypothetical protein